MKITLQKVDREDEEIIIKYHEMTREISDVVKMLSGSGRRLSGTEEGERQTYYFAPEEAYYYESVDGATYAYLERKVCRIKEKLEDLLYQYGNLGIVRCSRTMAVNLYKVEWLQSQPGGRILATLQNGERIVISRKYAVSFRKQLKKGAEHE